MLSDFFWTLVGGGYIAGEGIRQTRQRAARQNYIASLGLNRDRQYMLERMSTSMDHFERMAFARLCGYIPHGEHERDMAVREISIREGWRYEDIHELCRDPTYVKLNGGKLPSWASPITAKQQRQSKDAQAREHIAEVDRRKAWIERCEHGDEVDVFPMNYATEELYRAAVARAYRIKEQSGSGT